jgi:predicted TIM-barrel enzyme
MKGHRGNTLADVFGDALRQGDSDILRERIEGIQPSPATEEIGARLMAQDFYTETKIKLERLREKGNSGAGLRINIRSFFLDITNDVEEIMSKLVYYSEKPDNTATLDPDALATNRLKERCNRLPDEEIVAFAQRIADFPAYCIKEDSLAKWTLHWLPDARNGIVEELQDVRQSYLEEGCSEATQQEFAATIRWLNDRLDASSSYALPEKTMGIYPVVHINDVETAKKQSVLALDSGADGVYLINHGMGSDRGTQSIFETMKQVRTDRPNSFIGINLLGKAVDEAYKTIEEFSQGGKDRDMIPDALWADDVTDNLEWQPKEFLEQKNRDPLLSHVKLAGGIAFKYTATFTEDPSMAKTEVESLKDAVDIVTTSGAGTGQSPTVEKLRAIKAAAGDKPVAVASGISAENIGDFTGSVDQVLVSTSIETAPYSGIFDKAKLQKIIWLAHRIKL